MTLSTSPLLGRRTCSLDGTHSDYDPTLVGLLRLRAPLSLAVYEKRMEFPAIAGYVHLVLMEPSSPVLTAHLLWMVLFHQEDLSNGFPNAAWLWIHIEDKTLLSLCSALTVLL